MTIDMENVLDRTVSVKSLKIEVENALDICDQLDEPQKTIFETILRTLQFMISEKRLNVPELEAAYIDSGDEPKYVLRLCKATKMTAEDLEYLFNFKEDDLKLSTLYGDNWVEKQFNATISILTAKYYCFGKGEISSSELVEEFKRLKMGSMKNMSKNLNNYKHFIDVDGGHRKVYRLKGPGKKEGLKIIKNQILNHKGELDE